MTKKSLFKSTAILSFAAMGLLAGTSVLANNTSEQIAMYRVYNPNSGEHFYTKALAEKDYLVSLGWVYEGIGWYAPETGDDVYRLYNPNAGDHHYTLSPVEKDYLVKVGWRYEGVGWQSAPTSAIPLHRLYNPNATGAGSHHYTTNKTESDYLVRIGWKYENYAWYALAEGKPVSPVQQTTQPKPTTPATQVAPEQTSQATLPVTSVEPRKVDEHLTTVGGGEGNVPGSYRLLYSNKSFDSLPSSYATPLLEFSADVEFVGNRSADADFGIQFIIGGNGPASGQIGFDIGFQAGTSADFAQGRTAVKTVNFPADAGVNGEQFYSVNTSANMETAGHLSVQYFKGDEGEYVVTKLNNTVVGVYKTQLKTPNAYILHAQIDDSKGQASLKLRNVQVKKNGVDVTTQGAPALHVANSNQIGATDFDLTANTVNRLIHGAY